MTPTNHDQDRAVAPDIGSLADGLARERFPLLARRIGDRPLHYLDTAATAQKPDAVLTAMDRYHRLSNANVHRGLNTLASEATEAYEACRERVARLMGSVAPEQVVITRGATSSLNLLARGLETQLEAGDEILLTEMEHHANLVPWQMLARRRQLNLRFIPVDDHGALDLSRLPDLLTARTRIVSLVHVSNVLGTINPVAQVAEAAHMHGALVMVDAAQSVGHQPVDFEALQCDALAFSAHKAYGPMGLGFLVARRELLERMEPLEGGGEMIEWVHLDNATWAEVPRRFEAGTPNVAAAASFPPALDLLDELGAAVVRSHEEAATAYALDALQKLGGLTIFGPLDPNRRAGLVSFWDPTVHPHDMSTILDQAGVMVRAGHHCAQPLHRRLDVPATTRASFGLYTNRDDIDALVDGILTARKVFGR